MKSLISGLLATGMLFCLVPTEAQTSDTNSLTNGLVAYIRLGSSSGYNYCNPNNAAQVVQLRAGDKDPVGNNFGSYFDGSNSYVTISGLPIPSNNSFTWSLWFKTEGDQKGKAIMSAIDSLGNNLVSPSLTTRPDGSSWINFYTYPTGSMNSPHFSYSNNIWNHLTITSEQNGSRVMYLNGNAVATCESSGYGQELGLILIGANPFLSGGFFQGWIANIRIYNRALIQSEIQELIKSENGGFNLTNSNSNNLVVLTPPDEISGLVAYYPFNGNANDSSGHGLNPFVVNAILTNGINNDPNGAYYFNGESYITIFDIPAPTNNNFSYSLWLKPNSNNRDMQLYTRFWVLNGGAVSPVFGISASDSVFIYNWVDNDGGYVLDTSNRKIPQGTWSHLVVTSDFNGNRNIFINKEHVATGVSPSYGQEFGLSVLGNKFVGSLTKIRLYNKCLSTTEVAQIYNEEISPRQAQSISFPSISSLTLTNGSYTLGATASSGLPVTYSIGDSTVAGIANGSLIPLGVGTTTVVASQAGDMNWMPATPVTNPLIVSLAQQSFTPDPVITRNYGSLPFGLSIPTNASGIAVTPRIISGPATLSGTNLILTGTGTVTVAYDAPGNALYASNSVTNTFTVTNGPTNLKAQTITFKPLAAKTYGSAPLPLTASVKSGLPITYWSSSTNVAVISGTNAVIAGAGQAVITAYQPGDGTTYNPAPPVSASLIVNQAAQKITFKAPKTLAYGAAPALLNASSSVSNLPVTITSSDVNVARITKSGTNVLLVPTGTGTITLTANQSGNANVTAATPVSLPVVITPGKQTVTFSALGTNIYGASPITLSATSSAGLPVTFTSSAGNVASISGTTLTIAGAGSAKITASQSGNSLWAAAKPIIQTLKIAKAPQSIAFSITSSIAFTNGGLIPLTGTASSGLPVSYKSGNAKVLTIAGTNCLITGKGTTTVVASQAGGTNYLAAPAVTNTVNVQ
jgi:hypothetical protein